MRCNTEHNCRFPLVTMTLSDSVHQSIDKIYRAHTKQELLQFGPTLLFTLREKTIL